MSQYFDKDFLKFLIGFAAIIAISCIMILAVRLYGTEKTVQKADVEQVKN